MHDPASHQRGEKNIAALGAAGTVFNRIGKRGTASSAFRSSAKRRLERLHPTRQLPADCHEFSC